MLRALIFTCCMAGAEGRNGPAPAVNLSTVRIASATVWECTIIPDDAKSRVLVETVGGLRNAAAVCRYWLKPRGLAPARIGGKQWQPGDLGPYSVDFRHSWVYDPSTPNAKWESASGLARSSLDGRLSQFIQLNARAPVVDLVVPRSAGDRADAVVYDPSSDPLVDPRVRVYFAEHVGARNARYVPMARLPDAVLYAPKADRLFFVYANRVKEWKGKVNFGIPRPPRTLDSFPQYCPIDITRDAAFVYYADPLSRIISKIRVSTGLVVARRSLDFTPLALAVQTSRRRLLVAGEKTGRATTRVDAIHVLRGF